MIGKGLNFIPVLLLLVALPGLALGVQSKEFSRTVDFEAGGRLKIKTYKGSIHLTSWDRNEVEVYARIEAPMDVGADYARRSVEATRVEVSGNARSLTIRSDYDDVPHRSDWGGRSRTLPYVHYEIRAPRSLDLLLDDYKSDIEVYGFEGGIELETYKGTLEASDLIGELRLETYKGRANLTRLDGTLDVETYKGDISLGTIQITGDSRMETYKGEIELRLPDSQGLSIRADIGRKGDFHSDFDITMRNVRHDKFEGDINGGGPRLRLETYKGRIHLKHGAVD